MESRPAVQRKIIVCTALDEHYLPLSEIVATSIAASAAPGHHVEFHVLYSGPDSRATRRLERWHRPNVQIVLHRLANPWGHVGRVGNFPPSTLFRIAAAEVLTAYDRAIYVDADLIVEADLGELFDTPLEGRPFGAAIDVPAVNLVLGGGPEPRRTELLEHMQNRLGLDTRELLSRYVQTGVALLDLKLLREMRYSERMSEVIDRLGPDLMYADQCATNAVLKGQITLLDPRWNVTPESLMPGAVERVIPELRDAVATQRQGPRIIHFAWRKPWRRWGLPGSERWWHHARGTGLAGHYAVRFVRERLTIEIKTAADRLSGRRKRQGVRA